jgi:phage gpG-like protein
MSVSGSGTRELVLAIRRFNEIRDKSLLREINMNLAKEGISLVQRGFQTTTNPYGKKWEPAKYRAGQVLSDKRLLRNSFTRGSISATEFTIGTNRIYAKTHQYGATIVPKTAKRLVFKIQIATRVKANKRGKRAAVMGTVFAKKVVIPQRMMMPESDLPQTWTDAFLSTADEIVRDHFETH